MTLRRTVPPLLLLLLAARRGDATPPPTCGGPLPGSAQVGSLIDPHPYAPGEQVVVEAPPQLVALDRSGAPQVTLPADCTHLQRSLGWLR